MNKLIVLATIALVGNMAFAAKSRADDCLPWAGKDPRPASDRDQCKEAGFIASSVAELRDNKMPQADAAMHEASSFGGLQIGFVLTPVAPQNLIGAAWWVVLIVSG